MAQAQLEVNGDLTLPKPAKDDPIAYRWTVDSAEWGLTRDGFYRVLKCGDLEPDVVVRFKIPELAHRKGRVRALLPGWGSRPTVIVAVVMAAPRTDLKCNVDPKPILGFYRPDELEVQHARTHST